MPHSLVLNLVPRSPIYPNFLTGRHVHALFLEIVSSIDKPLADALHEQKTEKAFTLSPIQVDERTMYWQYDRPIPAGTPCWWRITLLDDALFGHLTKLWLNLNPEKAWHLGAADLTITSVLGTGQSGVPWANFVSYSELYEKASSSMLNLDLSFCTPTSFRQGAVDNPLPDRDRVFNSLIKKWNRYSGIEISPVIVDSIFPSYFDISTRVAVDSRSQFVGCVGEMSFKLLSGGDPILVQQFNALGDFALFAGVGRKTTMGMGMVRRVYERS
jgi:CRISPR-associated endoribonuclease Cas6